MISFADGLFDPTAFRCLKNFFFFDEIDSTNRLARGLIDHAAEEESPLPPTVIAARRQTAGRGRKDRRWESPRGGLYCTLIFDVAPGRRVSLLPLAAAVCVCEAVREASGVETRLKWPNDLYCRDRKLAGILAEARTRGEETQAAIGIGINVQGEPSRYEQSRATTVERESGREPSLSAVLAAVCRRFDAFLDSPAWETIPARWTERAVHRQGDSISIRTEEREGERRISGRYAGINSDGLLQVDAAGETLVVPTGEVERW